MMNMYHVMRHFTREYREYCDLQERLSFFYSTVGMYQVDINNLYGTLVSLGLLVTCDKNALYIVRNPNKTSEDLFYDYVKTTTKQPQKDDENV